MFERPVLNTGNGRKLIDWNPVGKCGISSVGVKSVDIKRTPMAKATFWAWIDAEARKHREQTGLDTLVVYAVNFVHLVSGVKPRYRS